MSENNQQDGEEGYERREISAKTNGNGIQLVIRAEYGNAVKGWEQIREELSLQDGECELEGVTIINQAENFHDGEDIPYGYGPITIQFGGIDAYKRFIQEVKQIVKRRISGGEHDGAGEVSDLQRRFPTAYQLETKL